jgi:hypothetical protein
MSADQKHIAWNLAQSQVPASASAYRPRIRFTLPHAQAERVSHRKVPFAILVANARQASLRRFCCGVRSCGVYSGGSGSKHSCSACSGLRESCPSSSLFSSFAFETRQVSGSLSSFLMLRYLSLVMPSISRMSLRLNSGRCLWQRKALLSNLLSSRLSSIQSIAFFSMVPSSMKRLYPGGAAMLEESAAAYAHEQHNF